jgi:hypothetical protein
MRWFSVGAWALAVDLLLWLWAATKFVMDWIGRSTIMEDAEAAQGKLVKSVDWLLQLPWYWPGILATGLTATLIWRLALDRRGDSFAHPGGKTAPRAPPPDASFHISSQDEEVARLRTAARRLFRAFSAYEDPALKADLIATELEILQSSGHRVWLAPALEQARADLVQWCNAIRHFHAADGQAYFGNPERQTHIARLKDAADRLDSGLS